MTGVFITRRNWDTGTEGKSPREDAGRGCSHAATSQGSLRPPESFPRGQREHSPANTLISNFWLPELWNNEFCFFEPPSLWYSWLLNNAGLYCIGPHIIGFSPPINTYSMVRAGWICGYRRPTVKFSGDFQLHGVLVLLTLKLFKDQLHFVTAAPGY